MKGSFALSQSAVADGVVMDRSFKYPKWQEPLAEAILEFNPQQLRRKAKRAEEAIGSRFQELAFEKGNQEELCLLSDGLEILQSLKRRRLASLEPKP